MQLTLDSAILKMLLERAVSASHLVSNIDERALDGIVEPLADHIDAIVHELSELLGNPHLVTRSAPTTCGEVAPARLGAGERVPQGDVRSLASSTRDGAPMLASTTGGVV